MRPLLLTFLLAVSFFCSYAQTFETSKEQGRISGKIIDSTNGHPVEYATISLLAKGTSKVISGTVTDAKGNFEISNISPGSYDLIIGFIGYQSRTLDIEIQPGNSQVQLNNVALATNTTIMSGVTVTASRPLIENKIDKMIYNVDKDISSQGGVAADVLKKVPQVTVDIDGNVELQGNSNIRFLIDGKPSSIFGSSLADALQSIPASQIQSIEVITSPGAKYDAQGTGGIINIILKKSRVRGINGNINLTAGTRLENGSFNMNYRHDNFGLHAWFGGNAQRTSTTTYSMDRTSWDTVNQKMTRLLQNGASLFDRNGYHTGISFDWDITKKDNITGTVSFSHFHNHGQGLTNQETIYEDMSANPLSELNTIRNSENSFNAHSVDVGVNYKKKFRRDNQELDVSYNTSSGNNTSFYRQFQTYQSAPSPFMGTTSTNPGTDRETDISVDYSHPISEHFMIETGAKSVQNNILSNAEMDTLNTASGDYMPDSSQSYVINYKRNVYGYYLSASFSLFNLFDIKAGGRYEYTTSKADYSNAHNVNIPDYNTFAPSFVVSHKFNDQQSIKFSYSYRIERPDYWSLNPFMNIADPHNISTGNPLLQPEIGHNYELGYNLSFLKGGYLNVSAFYRKNTNDIKSYTTYYASYQYGNTIYQDVSLTTRLNIGEEERTGMNLSGSVPVTSKLNLRTNILLANRHIINNYNGGISSNGFEYRVNLNGTYQFNDNLAFEAFGNYNSSIRNVQGRQPSFLFYNMAIRKQFMHKNASIAFTTTNPFTRFVEQRSELLGPNFTSVSIRQIPLQSFGLSFTYKFGKLEFKKPKEEDSNNALPNFDKG